MSSDGNGVATLNARAVLDAWRASGADRVDPLRFHLIDALDRRASAYGGPARQRLNERLTALIRAYEAQVDGANEASDAETAPDAGATGPLAELVTCLGHETPDPLGLRAAYPELPLLDEFRALWSRFSADRQVRQSQEQVHKNAGPLNSNQLVHRALSLMREMSPGYLQQFLSYTDALMWMEQMTATAAPAAKEAPRAGAAKKSTRGKSRKVSKDNAGA